MKPAAVRRILGLLGGAALLGVGATEVAISRSNPESSKIQPFCRAGFCPDHFSPERVFEISQKATLGDPKGELADFKQAVELSPASAYRWADLSEAEFNVRDYAKSEYALKQALQAGPHSPVILMRAANVEFQIGNVNQVVRYLVALLSDPGLTDYYDTAFLTYSRLDLPIEQLLQQGVPANTLAVSRLLTFWGKVNRVDEAVATWNWARARSLTDSESTGNFFAFLMKADRQPLAQRLWQEYVEKSEPEYRKINWIFNGGFRSTPVASPFDWKIEERQDVEAIRVQEAPQNREWSLRIRFNGEANTDYQQTYQDMVLEPGRYKFSAMMKSEQLTTDEGLRVHIFDEPTQAKLNIWTDTVTGTQGWRRIENTFEVPLGVKVVRLTIDRQMSMKFDNKIGGTAWIADLRLSRQ